MELFFSGNFHLYGYGKNCHFGNVVQSTSINSIDEAKVFIETKLGKGPWANCNPVNWNGYTKTLTSITDSQSCSTVGFVWHTRPLYVTWYPTNPACNFNKEPSKENEVLDESTYTEMDAETVELFMQ